MTLPRTLFGAPETWLPLLMMAVTVGFLEAVFFRGYVLAVLEPAFGVVVAVAVSAVLYALYHVGYGMGVDEMLFLAGLGILYATAFALARSVFVLWPLLTPLGGFFAADCRAAVLCGQDVPRLRDQSAGLLQVAATL